MPKIGSSRVTRLAVLLCGALAVGSASSDVSAADAGPLETLPGQVREATKVVEEVAKSVGPTVQEVTEAVPPPVTEVTETVTPPVVETTEAVVPPPKEAVETVTKATQEVTAKVPSLPTTAPPKTPATPATESSSGTKAVNQAVQTLTHDVEGAVGEVTGTAGSGRSSATPHTARVTNPSSGDAAAAATREAPAATEDRGASPRTDAGTAGATTMRTTGRDGLRDDKFAAPSSDGSIRAPLPKWMAYVWPAIALAWPELAVFLERWETDGARLALALTAAASPPSGGSGGFGVAGVHASHDAGGAGSHDSSSPFAPFPSAVGGFTSHVPGQAIAFLAIVAVIVASVFAVVKYEIAHRDRGPT